MRTIKLLLAYDGTGFLGWQRQARGPSVQGALEEALSRIEGAPVAVVGAAGSTAAGAGAACCAAGLVQAVRHKAPTPSRPTLSIVVVIVISLTDGQRRYRNRRRVRNLFLCLAEAKSKQRGGRGAVQ